MSEEIIWCPQCGLPMDVTERYGGCVSPNDLNAKERLALASSLAPALIQAAQDVIASFHAVGADKTGLVKWSVDAMAMKALILAMPIQEDQS